MNVQKEEEEETPLLQSNGATVSAAATANNANVPHFSLIMKFKLVFIRNFSRQMEYGMCGKVVNNNIERIK